MKKILPFIFFLFIGLGQISAQDIHFSQFFASPLTLNPANTGNFNGDWRLNNNYRNQWKSVTKSFSTNAISYDQQYYMLHQNLSGGFIWVNDNSGVANLAVNKVLLSVAYHKKIKENVFHGGIQMGITNKAVAKGAVSFPDQFNMEKGKFDPSMPTGELGFQDQTTYFDMNTGLSWNRQFRKISTNIGLSFFHINRPKENFFENPQRLPMRSSINATLSYPLTKKVKLSPQILYMYQSGATDYIIGSELSFLMSSNSIKLKNIYTGIYFRTDVINITDAAIAVAGMNFKNFNAGLSYDFNISSLNTASSSLGAFEISFAYIGLSTRLNKIKIPCERL